MLLIYTHKITPRFSYIMKQLFTRILGIEISFTTKVEDFIKHTGPKITYTKQPLQNEFFVRSNDLLFEQGINDIQINIGDWEGVPCFFSSGERSNIPYDIFSASFYLLSRYEEYLPHVKDIHGRFPSKASIAYQNGFIKKPVVDMWAYKLLEQLKERFPDIEVKKRDYKYTSVVDVTTSHCYAHRSFMRSLVGFFMDMGSFNLKRMAERIKVWFNPRKDPYDNFGYLVEMHKKWNIRSMFFFQFAEYSMYDKNISPNNNKFKFLIKSIADYSKVSLSASYSSFHDTALLKKEKKRLAGVINRPINYSRMRYNRVDIPLTYRNLVEAEFTDDYTMGYAHEVGFRAGSSIPFYLYDIILEVQQPIRVHPFAIHDYAFLNLKSKVEILKIMSPIYHQIKEVNGDFVTIFSNELLGSPHKVDWKDLYSTIIKEYNV
ncbi:MAG: polysaccharide deacetylase family protein [Flavobacteriaceae bacterium]